MIGSTATAAVAAYTVREAVRNRLVVLVLVLVVGSFLMAQFVAEVAITESGAIRAGFLGAVLRLGAVFTLALFVITSVVREFNDKVVELVLSHPVPRGAYVLGKLAGFSVLCAAMASLCGLCLLLVASPAAVLVWSLSLACELLLVAAVSLLCLFTFSQVTVALSAVMAFYLLARSLAAFRLIAESPVQPSASGAHVVMSAMVDALAFVFPALEQFTRSEWLVYGAGGWSELAPVLIQTLVYTVLVTAAALFDLYRRNL